METYRSNKARYVGSPFFPDNEEAFDANYDRIVLMNLELIRRAAKIPGLKMDYGTDAVAGCRRTSLPSTETR